MLAVICRIVSMGFSVKGLARGLESVRGMEGERGSRLRKRLESLDSRMYTAYPRYSHLRSQ